MSYQSVDELQKMLVTEVFGYAAAPKKAAGRALGTLVEIITYYTLCAWNLRDSIAIERKIPEFANHDIMHNVEFSLHPVVGDTYSVSIEPLDLPITARKILNAMGETQSGRVAKPQRLVTRDKVMRNAAVIAQGEREFTTANLSSMDDTSGSVRISRHLNAPFAIFECKRVGVEEGMKKGPQTIEKAKQGAYVARTVSSLQRFRLGNGQMQGVLDEGEGRLRTGDYGALLRDIIDGTNANALNGFILTVGVVSNHGNWFTDENHNKELRVLAHSYDWLLFLTDTGLCQFIEKLLIKPVNELKSARDAFLASYNAQKKRTNCFTKVNVHIEADRALKQYFATHESEVEGWFNVIAPREATIRQLRDDLVQLVNKDWRRIRQS